MQEIDKCKEEKLISLRNILAAGEYTTSTYRTKRIFEPKQRDIYILPFWPDRIVQHAIIGVLGPIWEKMFIADSYACRQGKGQHRGSMRCMQFVRRNRYCLQCDISKFYPSINHDVLMQIISKKIKCQRTLGMLREIINSIPGESNVPIGNYTSQWFGNLYLNDLDQVVKHEYKVHDYMRYCDDFLLFSNDKERLKELIPKINEYVVNILKMRLSKCNLFNTSQGVDFLGYRHFPSGKILLRKSTAKRVKKKIKSIPWMIKHKKITKMGAVSSVESIRGWTKWAHTHHFAISLKLDEMREWIENNA